MMNIFRYASRTLAACATFTLAASASADTSMWQVQKGDNVLYLGGTIHVLSEDDYPLPAEFNRAYEQAEVVVLETDAAGLSSPVAQRQMMSVMTYLDGSTLRDHVSRSTWRKLEQHAVSRGIPLGALQQFKAGMVAITLTVLELQHLGIASAGVDQHFANRAAQDGKPIDELETVSQQINFLSKLGEADPDLAIRYTLRDLKRLPSIFRTMKRQWRSGDVNGLQQSTLAPLRAEFPAIYDMLLVQRNRDWIPKLELMLDTSEVEMVLVGALHLVGEEGLLLELAEKGYLVTSLQQ